VLYIEDDSAPHTVSVHDSLHDAQLALREYVDEFVADAEIEATLNEKGIVATFAECGIYVRIYRCSDEGSVECPVEDRVEQSIA
jgi:hypothetical protein